jgi:Zn-dependent protease with chaperone function
MTSTPAPTLAGRFAAAIALTIGFYVLALVLSLGLLAIAVVPWFTPAPQNIFLSVTALVLGGSILIAIVPRRLRFADPGPKVNEADEPRLMGLIAEEARAAGESVPEDVYLTMEINAAVMQRSRTHRVMIVGIPLLQILSERQLRGVIAHEFGHYSGGDTRLGPWIYRTRETMGRTIAQLSAGDGDDSWSRTLVRLPFIWYGNAFLRITAAISRRQEFAADAAAVRRSGRATYVEALRRVHGNAPVFDSYWMEEVVPVLDSKRRPPVSDGFRHFVGTKAIEKAAEAYLQRELEEGKTDAYDSHPSLPERIAAIDGMPDGDPDDSPRSIELLVDPAAAEHRVLDDLIGLDARSFKPVAWEDVGTEVYVMRAETAARRFPAVLDGVTLASLPDAVERIPDTANTLRGPDDDPQAAMQGVAGVLGDGVLLALHRAGWTVEAPLVSPCGRAAATT